MIILRLTLIYAWLRLIEMSTQLKNLISHHDFMDTEYDIT